MGGRFALDIANYDAGYGFADGNDGSGTVAAEMRELDGLEAHGDFLIYNWPEKACLASEEKRSFPSRSALA